MKIFFILSKLFLQYFASRKNSHLCLTLPIVTVVIKYRDRENYPLENEINNQSKKI